MHRAGNSYSQFWACTHTFRFIPFSVPFPFSMFRKHPKSAGIARILRLISLFYAPKHGTEWNGTNGISVSFRFSYLSLQTFFPKLGDRCACEPTSQRRLG
jgi:hypothetical protein